MQSSSLMRHPRPCSGTSHHLGSCFRQRWTLAEQSVAPGVGVVLCGWYIRPLSLLTLCNEVAWAMGFSVRIPLLLIHIVQRPLKWIPSPVFKHERDDIQNVDIVQWETQNGCAPFGNHFTHALPWWVRRFPKHTRCLLRNTEPMCILKINLSTWCLYTWKSRTLSYIDVHL